MLRSIPGFVRRRLESFAFALLLAVVLLPLLAWRRLTCGPADAGRAIRLRTRWASLLLHGLADMRRGWWNELMFATTWELWHHVVLLEIFDVLNLASPGMVRPKIAMPEQARVLVIKLAHIGDTLHIFPMLRSLRGQRPGSRIDLMVGPWTEKFVRKFAWQDDVIAYSPHFSQFDRGNRRARRGLLAEFRFLMELRRKRYDLVISTSGTHLAELLVIWAANPTAWIGADVPEGCYADCCPAQTVPYDSRMYEADRVSGLLELAGLKAGDSSLVYPLTDEDRRAAAKFLDGTKPLYALVAPGAGWPGKLWPAENFAAVGDWLSGELGLTVVLAGSRDEAPLAEAIAGKMHSTPVNVAGSTTLDELAALLAGAAIFIGNDSSPMHFAATFKRPSVSLFGPTVASKWAPRNPAAIVLQHQRCEGCLPWHHLARCIHDGACMKAITVEETKQAVRAALAAAASSNPSPGEHA